MQGVARDESRRGQPGRRLIAALVVALVVVVLIVALALRSSDESNDESTSTTAVVANVSDSDEVVIDLPQSASLRIFAEDGTWFVENDGNVTMSEVEVRDGSDAVVCEIGTLAPDERGPCENAEGGDGLRALGSGPQGQQIEAQPG